MPLIFAGFVEVMSVEKGPEQSLGVELTVGAFGGGRDSGEPLKFKVFAWIDPERNITVPVIEEIFYLEGRLSIGDGQWCIDAFRLFQAPLAVPVPCRVSGVAKIIGGCGVGCNDELEMVSECYARGFSAEANLSVAYNRKQYSKLIEKAKNDMHLFINGTRKLFTLI
jgi:hypothetical protein